MSPSFLILSLVRTRFRYHDISSCCYYFVILNAIKLFSANYERQWCGDVSLVNFPDRDPDSLDYLVTGQDAYLEDDVFVYKHSGDFFVPPNANEDVFAAKFCGYIFLPGGEVEFQVLHDDGAILYIDGEGTIRRLHCRVDRFINIFLIF